MHELRTAIISGEVRSAQGPVARKESCRRKGPVSTLVDIEVAREERRKTNQRREDRIAGAVERATLTFRRKKSLVPVVNISGGGVMIESGIMPRIGETVTLQFEGFDPLDAVVRWIRQGRIGLDVGEDSIEVG